MRTWTLPSPSAPRGGASASEQVPQPLQRTGRCLAYGHVTYWALGEILREQLGILENEEQE